jgi:hypothetical protein
MVTFPNCVSDDSITDFASKTDEVDSRVNPASPLGCTLD